MLDTRMAFVTKSAGIKLRLTNEVIVKANGKSTTVLALWDTGATRTAISTHVAETLSLPAFGKVAISTPTGTDIVNTYNVDIQLPNNLNLKDVEVCDSKIGDQGLGVLIGMDIITLGDFCVSNFNGRTTFTFQTPSSGVTDYVAQIRYSNVVGPPHGKGKKNKSTKKKK